MKTIYICLTRSNTIVSKLVHLITSDPYTHASLAFDESMQPLYSSSRKNGKTMFPAGPCYEFFHRGIYKMYPQTPCAVYALQVSDECYQRAREEAERLVAQSDFYKFNQLGMLLCYMNIPYHPKKRYFCSQFVSEILSNSRALEFAKDPSCIRPMDYCNFSQLTCVYRGCIGELATTGAVQPASV